MTRRLVALAASMLALAVTACDLVPGASAAYPLNVENQAQGLDARITVNGREVGTVPSGESAEVAPGDVGPLPWHVEARTTASGRLISAMDVAPGSVWCKQTAEGGLQCSLALEVADLPCGRFVMYVSSSGSPSLPAPAPGLHPGPCEP